MKKYFFLVVFFISTISFSQIDYSNSWEDFYSYNNVKDFVKVDNSIYALADNAVFIYNIDTKEVEKLSSVQGLSGETTTAIHYNKEFKRLIIGYENGLIEIVDENNEITISSDIVNFSQSGEKSINHISEFGNKLYLSTPFAIVAYDIENLEFGDTYFIGNNSSEVKVNETTIFNNRIYAATEKGIFNADITSALLIDFNTWNQNFIGRNFKQIKTFKNQLITVEGASVFRINGDNLSLIRSFSENIKAINTSKDYLSVALNESAFVLNGSFNEVFRSLSNTEFNFTLNNVFFDDNSIYLATQEFGILTTNKNQSLTFTEIHPEGPLSNDVFSITAKNNNLWVVYGGYDETYTPIQRKQGFSHFNSENWINTRFDPNFPVIDLNHVSVDPTNINKVYISSFGDTNNINSVSTGGLLVVEDDKISQFFNHLNSGLEDLEANLSNRVTLRISGSVFDNQDNLWVANISRADELKKLSPSGQWSSFNLTSLQTNPTTFGLSELAVDKSNSIWIGTRRNGVYIYNENGNRKKALVTNTNQGNLPDLNVRTLVIDNSNRAWLGTRSGLVVYTNTSGVFDDNNPQAKPVVINADENGFGERLLGDQTINSIAIDGAENKWFGTDSGGVLYTNPNGQKTLANFSMQNSPLPSSRILKISVDKTSGKVFFATDKGIVAYNSKVAPFGETLGKIYAYPNPVLKNHEFVTIDGRNGTHLPKGTNVKILDIAGYLVYETNVEEGQELQGGKVIWDKTNLAGNKVASGVYIVLMANEDASETSTTKIAIVN